MTILNVVQPEEFDVSSFVVIDGKLKVAISSQEGNILKYKDDGLYAASSGGNGVLERYVYTTDPEGNVVHKGINFNIYLIDGSLSGSVYGVDPNAIGEFDMIYHSGGGMSASFDDEKYVLDLPWAVEHEQRVVLKMQQGEDTSATPLFWVVRVIRPQGSDVGVLLEPVTIVIDEMINVGSQPETPTDGPVIPELNSSHTLMHIGTIPPGMQNRHYSVALYDGDKFAIVELDDDKQPIFDSPDNITGQLAHPYTDHSVKEQFSYCPIAGTVIYYDGNNYWGIISNNRMVLDLPASSNDDVIIGTTLGSSEGRECIVFYSMDGESISNQILTDLSSTALGDRGTFSAPEGEICDYVVSGTAAHYLYVRDGLYVLHTIDLLTGGLTENSLVAYSEDDVEAKLIPTAWGGVIAYFDKGEMRLAFPYLIKMNTQTGQVELALANPEVIAGKLIFPDMLPNVGFAMNMVGMNFFKFFVDGISMAMTRFTADLIDGSFSLSSAPIPDNYMSLLMSGKMSIPLSYDLTTIGYDGSTDGAILSYAALEMGAVAAMYQSSALFKFDNGLAVLAHTPAGDLAIVKVNEDNTTDTTAYELHAEYSNTVQGFVEVAPALGVAVWKTRAGKIVFARFSETNSDVYITELGDSRYPGSSWIMIGKDSEGNYFVKEMQTNNGLELRVWCIAPDDTVTVYDHPDINIEGSFLVGSDILGDKLLAFGSTNNISHIRVLDARTGAVLTQGNFAFAGSFHNLKLQRIDHETLLIVENIGAVDSKPASIKVTLLKITATEVTVIKKSTLALGEWESLDGRSLTNHTYAGIDSVISYQSAIRDAKRYYVKITASQTDFTVHEQEVTQEILDKAGILIYNGTYPIPSVNLFNGDTGYLQHDLKLTSLNTFPLDMVEHDNSPKPATFTATWSEYNGQILLNGTMANPAPDTWTYIRLAVDTPSGVTHETKSKIGYNLNGVFSDNLWVISEPGEYVFRVSNWDGGPVMEARATVPNIGLDFTPPTVTPDGDGSWVLTTTNTGAIGRGVYGIYRSRSPISILDDYYNGSRYISDDAVGDDPMHLRFTIPASERNGTWYIMVGHQGDSIGGVWTPTFLTYTA